MDVTFSEDLCYFSPTVSPREEEKHVFYEDQFGELEDCVIVDSNPAEKDLQLVTDQIQNPRDNTLEPQKVVQSVEPTQVEASVPCSESVRHDKQLSDTSKGGELNSNQPPVVKDVHAS